MPTPYHVSAEAKAVTRRLEKKGLLDPNFWVRLVPAVLPGTDTIHYVLCYYAAQDDDMPLFLLHFMEKCKKRKSAAFIEQVQQELGWGYGEFLPNFMLTRKLPTTANRRRYKLQLLLDPTV